jgi:hypothetical protein
VLTAGSKTGLLLILKKGAVAIVKETIEIARLSEPGAVIGALRVAKSAAYSGRACLRAHDAAPATAALPSRPGEFHPEPVTEPDLTLSRHPARATARRLPASI